MMTAGCSWSPVLPPVSPLGLVGGLGLQAAVRAPLEPMKGVQCPCRAAFSSAEPLPAAQTSQQTLPWLCEAAGGHGAHTWLISTGVAAMGLPCPRRLLQAHPAPGTVGQHAGAAEQGGMSQGQRMGQPRGQGLSCLQPCHGVPLLPPEQLWLCRGLRGTLPGTEPAAAPQAPQARPRPGSRPGSRIPRSSPSPGECPLWAPRMMAASRSCCLPQAHWLLGRWDTVLGQGRCCWGYLAPRWLLPLLQLLLS